MAHVYNFMGGGGGGGEGGGGGCFPKILTLAMQKSLFVFTDFIIIFQF